MSSSRCNRRASDALLVVGHGRWTIGDASSTLQPRPHGSIENSVEVGEFDVPVLEWSYSIDDVAITDEILVSVEVLKATFSLANPTESGVRCRYPRSGVTGSRCR